MVTEDINEITNDVKGHALTTDLIEKFIFGGKAIFTVRNEKTMNRFVYKITKATENPKFPTPLYFVKVQTGKSNVRDFSYIGTIVNKERFVVSPKCKIDKDSPSVKGIEWLIRKIKTNSLPDFFKVYHEGFCGCCGKRLTVPESIEAGFGPECAKKLGISIYRGA